MTWSLPERLGGRRLLAARALWLAICVPTTALVGIGFSRAFQEPSLVEMASLTDVFATLGLDLRMMMALGLVAPFTTVVLVSAFVFQRRSTDPMALIFTGTFLTLYAYSSRSLLAFADIPVLEHAVSAVFAIAMIGLALTFTLFPDGRIAPRWARWLPIAMVALLAAFPDAGTLLMSLADGDVTRPVRVPLLALGWSAGLMAGLVAQARRYRHISGITARQQAKWVMAPLGLSVVAFVVVLLPSALPSSSPVWRGWGIFAIIPLGIVAPLMVANAVLRYRLYDIDRILSRTFSYVCVVVVLAVVYTATVLATSTVLGTVAGGARSELAVAASTLVAVALFRPLRARVQAAIDRRFNRTSYEGRVAIDDFAHRLRHDLDLAMIRDELAGVSAHVFQPVHSSVWLLHRGPTAEADPNHAAGQPASGVSGLAARLSSEAQSAQTST